MIRSLSSAATTASSNLRSDEPIGLCLTLDDARVVLEHWRDSNQHLGFSFFRAAEGAIQMGHATVACVGARSLTLGTKDRRFVVAIENACIEFAQVGFYRPGLGMINVEGLSMSLANEDWLFLFQESNGHARYSRYPAEAAIDSLAERSEGERVRSSSGSNPIGRTLKRGAE